MKYLLLKDQRRRALYTFYEQRRNVLLSIIQNISLPPKMHVHGYNVLTSLPRESSITQMRNRCTLTGRSRSIYRSFGLSRLIFRKLA